MIGDQRVRHPTVGATPCVACGAVRWTLAVTGSRTLTDPQRVRAAARDALAELVAGFGCRPCLVLHGNAPGVDRILAARLVVARWPVEAVPADWDAHGRKAGVLRDLSMVARADALLAVWDGTSPGTGHTLAFARQRGLRIACRLVGRHHTCDTTGRDDNRGDQGGAQQRQAARHRSHARRPTPATADRNVDAPRARTLLATSMACLWPSRAQRSRPPVVAPARTPVTDGHVSRGLGR